MFLVIQHNSKGVPLDSNIYKEKTWAESKVNGLINNNAPLVNFFEFVEGKPEIKITYVNKNTLDNEHCLTEYDNVYIYNE